MKGRLLVVGGTGLVGNALVRVWEGRGGEVTAATYHCHPGPGFRCLDMQDEPAVRSLLNELKPDFVSVPAANPFVDYCELHPQETRRTNVAGTINVARACAAASLPMVFYSSDYVFDGVKGSYLEEDPVGPVNEYGRQKAEVEGEVLRASPRNIVVRTAGAYGWQWEPKNFVLQILANLKAGKPLKAAGDIRFSPTYVENLADVVADLLEGGKAGLFHAVGADFMSRAQFARLTAETFGLDPALIEEVSSKDFSPPARRPKNASLVTEKVRRLVSTPLWGARQGLEHMKAFEGEWRAYAQRRLPAPATDDH
jgi:dTDP-4-dehydrorhamnose reductase